MNSDCSLEEEAELHEAAHQLPVRRGDVDLGVDHEALRSSTRLHAWEERAGLELPSLLG